ncbi:MAG: hypothetical protein Q8909_10060, partial [Bacteroidota bacterium]|nr:hypothetical protein [Bacteroidota bacterium]
DHIYQEVIQNPYVEQFIVITGDGHFSSVISFLQTFCDKSVGIFGVYNTLSKQLVNCSSWAKIIEDNSFYLNNLLCFKGRRASTSLRLK